MKYDLVFEGGGAKGAVFVGALKAFEEQKLEFNRLVGTSAGAITATLLAVGYDSKKMSEALNEKLPNGKSVFFSFIDIPQTFSPQTIKNSITQHIFQEVNLPLVPDWAEKKIDEIFLKTLLTSSIYRSLFSFVERGGLFAGDAFLNWFAQKLDDLEAGLSKLTLAQLFAKTGKDLSVIASNTAQQQRLILNHRTAPNCPVVWAVRMSMSIPFCWQEVIWQEAWGTYNGQSITGATIVDGGVLSNFAIDILLDNDKVTKKIMGSNETAHRDRIIGFLIDETLSVPAFKQVASEPDWFEAEFATQHHPVIKRVTRLVDTMTSAHDKFFMSEYQDRIACLPAKGYSTFDFNMSDLKRDMLVNGGYTAMQEFLNKSGLT